MLARHGAALGAAERAYVAGLPRDVLDLVDRGLASLADVMAAAARGAAVEDDEGWEMTAVVEPAEPAWLERARAALSALLSDSAVAPRATRDSALNALEAIISSASSRGEAAAGRAVYIDKLRRRLRVMFKADNE